MLLAQRRRIYQARAISQVTGLSEYVVSQYQKLIRETKRDKIKSKAIEEIIGQHLNYAQVKKTQNTYGRRVAVSMGGFE